MKEQFRDKRLTHKTKLILGKLLEIVEEYSSAGITLTLRQLYYQMVARGELENNEKNYKLTANVLKTARYLGVLDWSAVEDRTREPDIPNEWDSLPAFLNVMLNAYRSPRWADQKYYVELITEKDALSSVLAPIARAQHVTLNVFRGYSSSTAIYDLSKRILAAAKNDKKVILVYIGDHDPSGLDMLRDVETRLVEFCYGAKVFDLLHLALTMEQIREFNPPPDFAKVTDKRARGYIAQYGNMSWEVDALRPEYLRELLVDTLTNYLDVDLMQAKIESEKREVNNLVRFLNSNRGWLMSRQ